MSTAGAWKGKRGLLDGTRSPARVGSSGGFGQDFPGLESWLLLTAWPQASNGVPRLRSPHLQSGSPPPTEVPGRTRCSGTVLNDHQPPPLSAPRGPRAPNGSTERDMWEEVREVPQPGVTDSSQPPLHCCPSVRPGRWGPSQSLVCPPQQTKYVPSWPQPTLPSFYLPHTPKAFR